MSLNFTIRLAVHSVYFTHVGWIIVGWKNLNGIEFFLFLCVFHYYELRSRGAITRDRYNSGCPRIVKYIMWRVFDFFMPILISLWQIVSMTTQIHIKRKILIQPSEMIVLSNSFKKYVLKIFDKLNNNKVL